MEFKRWLLLFPLLCASAFGQAANFYVTVPGQGSDNGSSLANAMPLATFSGNSSVCGTGSTQIGAGTVVHINVANSGTSTETYGTNANIVYLECSGTGTGANRVFYQFQSGDQWQASYFASSGAIHGASLSHVKIDGGGNYPYEAISSLSTSGGVATGVCATSCGTLATGQTIAITDSYTPCDANQTVGATGSFVLTGVSGTTFTFNTTLSCTASVGFVSYPGAIIQNTLNGSTTGNGAPSNGACPGGTCQYSQESQGVVFTGVNDMEVSNFMMLDHYDAVVAGDPGLSGNTNAGAGISIQGSNVEVDHNIFRDMGNAYYDPWGNGDAHVRFDHNNVQQAGWGIGCSGGSGSMSDFAVDDNHFYNFVHWSNTPAHENGIHCFDNSGGGMQSMYYYNNLHDGNMGSGGWTAWTYLEANGPGGNWNGTTGLAYFFGNIWNANNGSCCVNGNGMSNYWSAASPIMINNFWYGVYQGGPCSAWGGLGLIMENNVIENCGQFFSAAQGGQTAAPTVGTFDYNMYAYTNNTSGGSSGYWQLNSIKDFTLSQWQSDCSCDPHSQSQLGSVWSNVSTVGVPSAGFAGISAGMTGSTLATLCTTIGSGNSAAGSACLLGSTGGGLKTAVAWPTGSTQLTVGPYPYVSGGTYTITVSSITGNGTVTSSDSVLNCTTGTTGTCSDSSASGTITLTATPSSGYSFTSWGGGTCSGSSTTCNVTGAATVTATFTAIPASMSAPAVIFN